MGFPIYCLPTQILKASYAPQIHVYWPTNSFVFLFFQTFAHPSFGKKWYKIHILVFILGFPPTQILDASYTPEIHVCWPTNSFLFLFFQTFCVVSRRFNKHYVQRFSATRSLFIFAPWNTVRSLLVFLCTNQYFDYLVMLTILVNCIFLALPENVEEAE